MIRKIVSVFVLAFGLVTLSAAAQHSSVDDDGSLGMGFHGDTWTGNISAVDGATHVLTITDEHKGKTETFSGTMKSDMQVLDSRGRGIPGKIELKPGTHVQLYYETHGKERIILRMKMLDVTQNPDQDPKKK